MPTRLHGTKYAATQIAHAWKHLSEWISPRHELGGISLSDALNPLANLGGAAQKRAEKVYLDITEGKLPELAQGHPNSAAINAQFVELSADLEPRFAGRAAGIITESIPGKGNILEHNIELKHVREGIEAARREQEAHLLRMAAGKEAGINLDGLSDKTAQLALDNLKLIKEGGSPFGDPSSAAARLFASRLREERISEPGQIARIATTFLEEHKSIPAGNTSPDWQQFRTQVINHVHKAAAP